MPGLPVRARCTRPRTEQRLASIFRDLGCLTWSTVAGPSAVEGVRGPRLSRFPVPVSQRSGAVSVCEGGQAGVAAQEQLGPGPASR